MNNYLEQNQMEIITKTFNGKAIYNPSGKAGEYAEWACNFYTGCSNNCNYCYCKRGVMSHTWSTTPKLKSCFKDENHALEVFEKELKANLSELQEHGLFFSFTTDPMLPETIKLTLNAASVCADNKVPIKILTKRTEFLTSEEAEGLIKEADGHISILMKINNSHYVSWNRDEIDAAFGFTLTGHDDLEPSASTNAERIEAMRRLHTAGFKTWASVEPVIDFKSSLEMITKTVKFCDLYKIGLMSGWKYNMLEIRGMMLACFAIDNKKFYFKDSLLSQADFNREDLPSNCVNRNYNLFN